jgi:hypothetical protein
MGISLNPEACPCGRIPAIAGWLGPEARHPGAGVNLRLPGEAVDKSNDYGSLPVCCVHVLELPLRITLMGIRKI